MSEFDKKGQWISIPERFECFKCKDDAISIFTHSKTGFIDFDNAECRICGATGVYHQDLDSIVWDDTTEEPETIT